MEDIVILIINASIVILTTLVRTKLNQMIFYLTMIYLKYDLVYCHMNTVAILVNGWMTFFYRL